MAIGWGDENGPRSCEKVPYYGNLVVVVNERDVPGRMSGSEQDAPLVFADVENIAVFEGLVDGALQQFARDGMRRQPCPGLLEESVDTSRVVGVVVGQQYALDGPPAERIPQCRTGGVVSSAGVDDGDPFVAEHPRIRRGRGRQGVARNRDAEEGIVKAGNRKLACAHLSKSPNKEDDGHNGHDPDGRHRGELRGEPVCGAKGRRRRWHVVRRFRDR